MPDHPESATPHSDAIRCPACGHQAHHDKLSCLARVSWLRDLVRRWFAGWDVSSSICGCSYRDARYMTANRGAYREVPDA